MQKIKNVNGSSRFSSPAGYNTWLDYWEAKSGKTASRCSATDDSAVSVPRVAV